MQILTETNPEFPKTQLALQNMKDMLNELGRINLLPDSICMKTPLTKTSASFNGFGKCYFIKIEINGEPVRFTDKYLIYCYRPIGC